MPNEAEVFELSQQQIDALERFLSRYDDDANLHWQLARFIEGHLSNFDYYGQTLTASQALQDQKGDCMSLAIITAAFTRHLGLEHNYQLMLTPPTFERHDDLVLVSDHVRTRVYPPAGLEDNDRSDRSTRRAIIDYFPSRERQPSRPVAEDEFLAMYYRNVAAEVLVEGELEHAFWLIEKAARIDPDNASVLNLAAVIHRRAGDYDTAEALLRYTAGKHPNDVNVLHNLHTVLERRGHDTEARAVLERLAHLPDHNPYPRLMLARELVESGQLDRALEIYEAVIEQMPYVHMAYWGLATVHYKQGDEFRARQAMEQALELAHAPRHERMYTAKLDSLEVANPKGHAMP
ncbi:tetratricopeptide repeat protein [Wenzhouxiangella sp. AB-CW3]|uniref:tetratricopeptide repeat protein n=1 Tax=Wenzhouxiangella sp. AB-CW3 TaxID=2771012 RepID=UPI00168BF2A5|nr:tetratricopeptide repeat protein [Wenzhouxiangella sp. AB-CW3]QOC23269.1 tetratricopeptide repeat protein [Wenzhouxiangella sp. AB-CW3]